MMFEKVENHRVFLIFNSSLGRSNSSQVIINWMTSSFRLGEKVTDFQPQRRYMNWEPIFSEVSEVDFVRPSSNVMIAQCLSINKTAKFHFNNLNAVVKV